ncbi:MAG: hypothetical protein DWQ30_00445 [Acidobacteria bacterium]|nr:MAG: hypothetical protein DWQ30_00445 [Acidobacteriota bacterium]
MLAGGRSQNFVRLALAARSVEAAGGEDARELERCAEAWKAIGAWDALHGLHGPELMGQYLQWNWLAELAAWQAFAGAHDTLRTSLRRTALLWSAAALPRLVHQGSWRPRYVGPGARTAGLRALEWSFAGTAANAIGCFSIGAEPGTNRYRGPEIDGLDAIRQRRPPPLFTASEREELHRLIGIAESQQPVPAPSPGDYTVGLWLRAAGDLRTIVPYRIERSLGGVVSTWIEEGAGGQTAPTWCVVQQPDGASWTRVFPYEGERVRKGDEANLGQGRGWVHRLEGGGREFRVVPGDEDAYRPEGPGVRSALLPTDVLVRFELFPDRSPVGWFQGERVDV